MLEKEFQTKVIELAQLCGWRVAHFRTAQNASGKHMTPVAADGAGWPDLVLVHPIARQLLFRELKSDTGRLAPNQTEWLSDLRAAGANVAVWRPEDFDMIAGILSGGRAS